MGTLIVFGIIVAAIAAFEYAALRLGVDSRPGFGDERAPSGKLAVR